MEKTIKPCPHCGGMAYLNSNYSYKTRCHFVFVKCDICSATGKTVASKTEPAEDGWTSPQCEQAINAWNMRTPEPVEEKKIV